ncbi:hypothetical protein FNH22_09390 [Fulvivirga sp. M361]|uniref:choice-of-anchor J domain-containing protein n=1 Tax=Fulvivirga sp. M361 TaxID=2594266 RepID=UPI00117A9E13|nr:choice-of-anchor J domain-containing protein [Fulvivirga sp. M361]TRX59371.1 hypothetical protein FNH22_09390 [Fulvivirga sp. M361]
MNLTVTRTRFILLLAVVFLPLISVGQISDTKNSTRLRPNVKYNYKKLAKQVNPGLRVTGKWDNPALRAAYDFARLANPGTGKIPDAFREKELNYVRSSRSGLQNSFKRPNFSRAAFAAGDQSTPWVNRGPFNVGGRTRALAIDRTDENIILAGGVSGGLWRSTDQGLNWVKITPGQEHPSITDIVQDPRPGFENVWYYGTGELSGNSASDNGAFYGGNGVYKSTDGGLTFNVLPSTQNNTPGTFSSDDPFDLILGVDINPLNGDLYVASFVGVHRSTDGGATFEEVIPGEFADATDIHITSTGVLYATISGDAADRGLFRSTDGAAGTWTNITPAAFPASFGRTVIHTAPGNENVLYLLSVTPGSGTVGMSFWKYTYVSGDGTGAGGVWENRSANIPTLGGNVGDFEPQGGYNLIVRVHPNDENIVFIGGTNIYRSFDGFATGIDATNWVGGYAVTNDFGVYTNHHPDQHGMEFFASNPDKVISSHDGGVSITDDIRAFDAGGPQGNESVTWTSLNNGYLTTQVYALSIGPGDQLQAGFQDNSTWFINNTGSENPWTQVAGADGAYNSFSDDGTLRYVSFQRGTTFRQEYSDADSDSPLTFDFITPNGASGFLFVNPFELDPNNDEIMYMAAGTSVWRNDDLPNATPVVGWTQLTNASLPSGSVSAIGISTLPANILYFGSTEGELIKVENASTGNPTGVSVAGSNFPSGNITSIDVNPSDGNDVIVSFSNYGVVSIFRTIDGGSNWTDISGNLEENVDGTGNGPSVRWVTRVGFNDRFFAATSTGLYSTELLDGTSTVWTQESPDGIGNVVIEQIRKRDSDGLVVLGTHGNGLYSANFEVTPPAILVTNPVANFEVDVNSEPTVLDLANVFESTLDPPSSLTLTASNDNATLLTATLSGTELTLTYNPDEFGEALITLTATDEAANEANESFTVTVNPPPLVITEFPYVENFENGEDGPGSFPRDWQVTAAPPYTWTVLNGPTPTGGFNGATGPLVDHTTGTPNGFYVYTESSGGVVGDTTELITPPVVITGLERPSFEFWYHLFGDDIVSFEVEVVELDGTATNVFSRTGPVQTAQEDPYLLQIISLEGYSDTLQVVFRGIRGAVATDGFLGDMAMDDVRFFEAPEQLVVADPLELSEELEQGETSTQTLTLTNVSDEDVTFDISLEDEAGGVGTSSIKQVRLKTEKAATPVAKRASPFTGVPIDANSSRSIPLDNTVGRMSTEQYGTGFEDFLEGDINGQQGWVGQFANWVIETTNPAQGSQQLRSLSDGLGQTLAFSPSVPIGTDPVSSLSVMLSLQGTGTTWEIIPQSPSEELVNTRLRFTATGGIEVLISDGLDGSLFVPIPVAIPDGYFKVDIEIVRATREMTISFDDEEVFSGPAITGNIEELVLLSPMEIAGSILDIDDVQILDGEVERGAPFVSVTPLTGIITAGSSVDLDVTFDATDQDFGTFNTNIVATINEGNDDPVIVPVTLNVIGDPAILVEPTVVQEVVDFNVMSTRIVEIQNTGGEVLDYNLTVIGADIGISTTEMSDKMALMTAPEKRLMDSRVTSKLNKDNAGSIINDVPLPNQGLITIGDVLFSEDFEGGIFPPEGWTRIDNEGTGVEWSFAADAGEGNYAGSDEAATVSSDEFGEAEHDAELWTPVINVAGRENLTLKYNVNYQNLQNLDFFDLDISTDGGATWVTLLSWNEDHGAFRSLPGEQVNMPLDDALAGAEEFIIRWHYYDPNTGDFNWYAQIDDVEIIENTEVWMALDKTSGTVEVGETAEVELRFDPTVVDPGFYVAGIIVNSNALNTPEVGVVVSMQELNAAKIVTDTTLLVEELVAGRSDTQSLTISNEGESALNIQFKENFLNVGTVAAGASTVRTMSIDKTLSNGEPLDLISSAAIMLPEIQGAMAIEPPVEFADIQYATNFDTFSPGDINGQQGWAGQFVNWVIDTTNSLSGSQHIRSVADGLGQTLAFTPEVGIGMDAISSMSVGIDLDGLGATWQVIPQSNTAELVVTRVIFNADGTISGVVADNGGELRPIDVAIPEGYFEVSIEVERATSLFTVYFDGEEVFTGEGFTGDIEQVVLLGAMEISGPVMDIDNLQIVDGRIPEPSLSVSPSVATLAAGESLNVAVTFDATNLTGGVYEEDLIIVNNDPTASEFVISTILTVIDAQVIAVNPDSVKAAIPQGEMVSKTLTIANEGEADLIFKINIESDLELPAISSIDKVILPVKDWRDDEGILNKLADSEDSMVESDGTETPQGLLSANSGRLTVLFEDFEGDTFAPEGWKVVDNEGTGVVWGFAAVNGESNYTGTGEAATASSDAFGTAEYDTELWTPELEVAGPGMVLEYLANYQNLSNRDFLDADISVDGGASWTTMLSWNEDHGAFFSTPGELVTIQLDDYLAGAETFIVRWRYYNPLTGDFDWYAQIDDVSIGVTGLTLSQLADTIPGGSSVDIEVKFDASMIQPGRYGANLVICSDDLRNPEVTVPAILDVLQPPTIAIAPDTLKFSIFEGFETEGGFNISNLGAGDLDYNIASTPDFVSVLSGGTGVITPGSNVDVSLNISAVGLLPGSYIETILIDSNDPNKPVAEVIVDLTVMEFVVLDMELESVCSDNPDAQRVWKVNNPNTFEWDAFWFIIGSTESDSITLQPGENMFYSTTLTDRPNTLKLKWLDEDDNTKETIEESAFNPCEIADLNLTSVCSNNPELFRRWRVRNPNPFVVMIDWEVVGTTQMGMINVAANDDTFFFTEALSGPNTTKIKWLDANGELQEVVKASSGEMCDINNACNGGELIAFDQGKRNDGRAISGKRSNATNAIGTPEQGDGFNFVSLGFGGSVVIALNNTVFDQPGNDFLLIETSFRDANRSCDSYPETADVFVSRDGEKFFFVGQACKDTEFDIASAGLMDISYVKVVDTSNPEDFGPNADGFDVDGIACINAHSSQASPFSLSFSENNVPDEEVESTIITFPNPFVDKIDVSMEVEEDGRYEMIVHDLFGTEVFRGTVESTFGKIDTQIHTQNLADGTYTLTILAEDNSLRSSSLLIKQ